MRSVGEMPIPLATRLQIISNTAIAEVDSVVAVVISRTEEEAVALAAAVTTCSVAEVAATVEETEEVTEAETVVEATLAAEVIMDPEAEAMTLEAIAAAVIEVVAVT